MNKREELRQELFSFGVEIFFESDRLFLCSCLSKEPIFAQDHWPQPQILSLDERKHLKSLPYWGCFYFSELSKHERTVRSELKNLDLKRIKWQFPNNFNFKFFTWTIFQDQIIYCTKPLKRFPLGWHEFIEDKNNPPNRAYLKLWEVLTVYFDFFQTSPETLKLQTCLEVGASPGGWTWVMMDHFKKVYAIDRSPLASQIKWPKHVHFQTGDAFALNPEDYLNCDWFFSDLICTPEKLFEFVKKWLDQSRVQNFVCTLKFKGEVDFELLKRVPMEAAALGESKLVHLYHNKNEVTWLFKKMSAKI